MAEPAAPGHYMIITILYSDNNPSDYHRLLLPAKYIEDPSITIRLVKHTECKENEDAFNCDIVFLSRLFIYDWSVMEQLRKKYGFKIIVDFDDHYTLSPHQLRYKLWQEHNVAARMIDACKGADMVFVTNEQLYNVYKQFNKNVQIVPNAVPFNEQNVSKNCTIVPETDKFVSKREPSDKIRFIYAAGASHYHDLKLLKGLFDRLRSDSQFKDKATFTFCGYDDTDVTKKMESICKINGSYVRRDILPLDRYMEHYNYGDVSIAPLVDNFYNRCKSNLKFIEAASMKMPFICSEISTYAPVLGCKNTGDWYKAFRFFINNPDYIAYYGNENYEHAKGRYNLRKVNELRVQAFESFYKNRLKINPANIPVKIPTE